MRRRSAHEDTLARIATMAAEATVEKTLLALGVDISTPAAKLEMQERFLFLATLKRDLRLFKSRVIQVVGGALALGLIGAVWQMFRPPGL